jgi:hypothetical protein
MFGSMKQVVVSLLVASFLACGGIAPAPRTEPRPVAVVAPSFADKAWRVVEGSDIPAGAIYVFLSDNTLLITSATGTPMLGRWLSSGTGLTMIEEGMSYRTEIVESSDTRLVLRQHNPGGIVKLVFAPARALRTM